MPSRMHGVHLSIDPHAHTTPRRPRHTPTRRPKGHAVTHAERAPEYGCPPPTTPHRAHRSATVCPKGHVSRHTGSPPPTAPGMPHHKLTARPNRHGVKHAGSIQPVHATAAGGVGSRKPRHTVGSGCQGGRQGRMPFLRCRRRISGRPGGGIRFHGAMCRSKSRKGPTPLHFVPLRPGAFTSAGVFDGAISISALQWLCNADRKEHVPQRRLKCFFMVWPPMHSQPLSANPSIRVWPSCEPRPFLDRLRTSKMYSDCIAAGECHPGP